MYGVAATTPIYNVNTRGKRGNITLHPSTLQPINTSHDQPGHDSITDSLDARSEPTARLVGPRRTPALAAPGSARRRHPQLGSPARDELPLALA